MRILVDTNILIRSVQRRHPLMQSARQALKSLNAEGNELCVTSQNIAEFWNVCTRPADVNGLGYSIGATDRLTARIEMFFTLLPDTPNIFWHWRRLIVTHEVRGAKVHDARLVAAMETYSIGHVLTFKVGDFGRFTKIVALNPVAMP